MEKGKEPSIEPGSVNREFLKDEYFHLQKVIEDFDQKALTIKAWSITVSLAAIAASFTQGQPLLCLVASISSLFFWIIESYWKTFQYPYYGRIKEIEDYFSGKISGEFYEFQISNSWYPSWKTSKRRVLMNCFIRWPHVYLPHAPIIVSGLVIFFLDMIMGFIG